MKKLDRDYYRSRIAAEESAARNAACPEAANRHRQLAELYASLVANDEAADPADATIGA